MDYKLIVSDFDMTLTTTDRVITDRTKQAIATFQEKGGKFVLCSARPLNALTDVLDGLKVDAIISSQGASIYDMVNKKFISRHSLDFKEVREITNFLKPITKHIHLINDNEQRCRRFSLLEYGCNKIVNYKFKRIGNRIFKYFPDDGILQVMTGAYNVKKMDPLFEKVKNQFQDKYEVGLCDKRLINLTKKGVSKGNAITEILAYYNLDKEQAVAFGDSPNDASMFTAVKTGVAMGNSMEQLIKVADVVCGHCDEDGLAKYVEEFVL